MALPRKALPLMTCCSGSESQARCGSAISYQDFTAHTDLIMLEMCGNTPAEDGTWDTRIASQALHLGIAQEGGLEALGLGYGFYPDAAFFVWACCPKPRRGLTLSCRPSTTFTPHGAERTAAGRKAQITGRRT